MRYNKLGNTGLFVSELCFGAMTFGASSSPLWGTIAGLDQSEATSLLKTGLDAGINFIDTANVYSEGNSERITGQALRDLGIARESVIVATKGLGPMGQDVNARGASRFHLMSAIDASLSRMQLDHVDLYQIHGWDPATPIDETLRALDDIVRSGRARYIGVSNWAAWQIMKALGISERKGLERFASLQAYYSIAGRDLESDLVPMLESEGVGLMVWGPLASGFLSGKYTRENSDGGRRTVIDFPPVNKDQGYEIIDAMRAIATARGGSVAQVALAWLLAKPVVTSVIIGVKRADQLADNLGAVDLALSPEDVAELDAVSAVPLRYPGWMLARQGSYRSGMSPATAPLPQS